MKFIGPHKFQVEGPDSVMLSYRQGPEGTVECLPGPRDLALLHEKLAVVQPDPRHLESN